MLNRCLKSTLAAVLIAAAGPAIAHPHVFADAGYLLIFDDQGRLAALRIDWRYDELFSLLMVEEKGADADADGEISQTELTALQDFDSVWPEDYDGDLHVHQRGERIRAAAPEDWAVAWQDGKLVSSHTRRFDPPLDLSGAPVTISHYDPGYYVACAITPEPAIEGREDCRASITRPDLDDEARKVAEDIAAIPPDVDLAQLGYLEVGARFAETVTLTCGR